jgi:hypothetical protein
MAVFRVMKAALGVICIVRVTPLSAMSMQSHHHQPADHPEKVGVQAPGLGFDIMDEGPCEGATRGTDLSDKKSVDRLVVEGHDGALIRL